MSLGKPNTVKILAIALFVTLLYALLSAGIHFPLIGDDYIFAARSYESGFGFWSFDYLLAKRPLAVLIDSWAFKSHLYENSQLPFYVIFFSHAAGLIAIASWLVQEMNPIHRIRYWGWGLAFGSLICLYPSSHEILLISTDLPYALGTPLLAVFLWSEKKWVQFIAALSAFCLFESYVLPALLLPWIPFAYQNGKSSRQPLSRTLTALVGLICYFILRQALAPFATPIVYGIDLSVGHLLSQARVTLKFLWVLHFYKEYWVYTGLMWLATGIAFGFALRTKALNPRFLILFLLFPFVASSQNLLLPYYAPRAVHGGVVVELSLLWVVFDAFARTSAPKMMRALVFILLAVAFFGQTRIVYSAKAKNQTLLVTQEKYWIDQFNACASPCSFRMGDLGSGFKSDWTLPQYSYSPYLRWIQRRNGIHKEINLVQ